MAHGEATRFLGAFKSFECPLSIALLNLGPRFPIQFDLMAWANWPTPINRHLSFLVFPHPHLQSSSEKEKLLSFFPPMVEHFPHGTSGLD